MTIKLLWLPLAGRYDLRVFAGDNPTGRDFVGQLQLAPAAARAFRSLLLAGDATLGESIVSEVGWDELEASQ